MSSVRKIFCVTAVAVATAVAGCGSETSGEGYGDAVDRAQAAKTVATLQTGLVSLAVAQADYGGGAEQDVVGALQSKDPNSRYTTAPPTQAGEVQVLGASGGAVMLVALSDPGSEGRPPQYVAAWQGAGSTMYYAGAAPPSYSAEAPAGPGWSSTLPQ